MDSLPGGAALARGLLVLARAGRSGVLTVQSREVTARVGVNKGRVVAMKVEPEDGDSLGDALRRMGDWDEEAAASHGQPAPGEAVGGWAVRVGATSDAALSLALRKQLQRRIARLFAVDPPELRLRPGSLDVGVPQLVEPPTTAELIVGALRDRVASQPLLSARRRLGDGILVLTPLGKELLADAVLWPDEQAMLPLLESGASVDVLVAASQGSARAQRVERAALRSHARATRCCCARPGSSNARLARRSCWSSPRGRSRATRAKPSASSRAPYTRTGSAPTRRRPSAPRRSR